MNAIDNVQPVVDMIRERLAEKNAAKVAAYFAGMNAGATIDVWARLDPAERLAVRAAIISVGRRDLLVPENLEAPPGLDAKELEQSKESTMKTISEWAVIVAAFLGIILAVYVVTNFVGKSPNVTEMVVMKDGSLCAITNRTSVQCQPGAQADMSVRK